jgi:hypothetical protein
MLALAARVLCATLTALAAKQNDQNGGNAYGGRAG